MNTGARNNGDPATEHGEAAANAAREVMSPEYFVVFYRILSTRQREALTEKLDIEIADISQHDVDLKRQRIEGAIKEAYSAREREEREMHAKLDRALALRSEALAQVKHLESRTC